MSHLFFLVWCEERDGHLWEFAEPRVHPTFLAAQDDRVWCMSHLDEAVPAHAYRPNNTGATGKDVRDPRGPHVTEIHSPMRKAAAA